MADALVAPWGTTRSSSSCGTWSASPPSPRPTTRPIDPSPFEAFVRALAESFPLLHEHLTLHRVLRALAAASTGRAAASRTRRADGAHRRRARRRVGALAAPAVLRRRSTTARSGAAAPSTTRARWSGSAARSSGCWRDGFVPARDVWLSFGASEETSGAGRAGRRRGAPLARRHAVVRARRGRRDRPRGVPRSRTPARRRRRLREGHHHDRAARRGPWRPLLDTGARAARPRGSPGPSYAWRSGRSPPRCPSRPLEMFARLAPHAPLALRPLFANAPPRCSRCSSGRCWLRARSPPPWCVRRWP